MAGAYRDEQEAALAQSEALQRENERLRGLLVEARHEMVRSGMSDSDAAQRLARELATVPKSDVAKREGAAANEMWPVFVVGFVCGAVVAVALLAWFFSG